MDPLDEAARYWRGRLQAGQPIYRVRVRKLLDLRGAERRGSNIMAGIRSTLESYGLFTEPDFQSVWPDSLVTIKLRHDLQEAVAPEGTPFDSMASPLETDEAATDSICDVTIDSGIAAKLGSESDEAEEVEPEKAESLNSPAGDAGLVQVAITADVDPLIRISSIPSSKNGVATVLLDDTLQKATTLMMFAGYSQLAIMQGDREVRGLISWESIAKRSLMQPSPKLVRECRIDAPVIDSDASLHDAVPVVSTHGCVLVRSRDRKITGIVTGSDLSEEFGRTSYAFLCLRTIEILIRGKLHPKVNQDDLNTLEEHSKARRENDPSALTFGENVRLLERLPVWERLGLSVDRGEVTQRLLEIRDVRNEVMHFGKPISDNKRLRLEQMEAFLKQVFA